MILATLLSAMACLAPYCALAGDSADVNSGTPPDLSALHWRLVGPFRGGWAEMVVGIPDRPNTFLFGAAGGGVWRTDNAGRTWTPLFDHGPAAPVGAIAIAPSDPETLYIGTGQPEPRYDVAPGAGVFRSRDGGKTWSPVGLGDTRHIGKIWVDPKDPNVVLVAAVGHFFGPNRERGVFRSTDGGQNWSHVLRIDDDTGAVDLVADPADSQVIFAATWQARQYPWQSYFTPIAGPGSGIYRSNDGGRSWARVGGTGLPAGPLGRIGLATTRTPAGLRVYATVGSEKEGGIYRSDDGGATWLRTNKTASVTNFYSSRILAAPGEPDVVYVVDRSLRRCKDAGRTCEVVKGAPGGDDFHHVWINPAHPDHIAAASDQGTTISVDGGQTWSSWYNQPTGQFYHLATDDRFPYTIYSGQQDSGTVAIASRSDFGSIGPRDWHPVGGDEREYEIPDPDDPAIVYTSGLGGRVTRFDSRTGQVANITPFPVPNYGKRQISTEHHFAWVTPLVLSPTQPRTLYLGGEHLFASSDRGRNWKILGPDLTGRSDGAGDCDGNVTIAHARACGYGSIWSIALSARNAGEIWVGTDSGLVHVSRDGGAHWEDRTPAGLAPWSKISSIDLSGFADGLAYVSVDRQRIDDPAPLLLRTRDYGLHWQEISRGLPAGRFTSVVRADPRAKGLLYAGTETGVFVSIDDGDHWVPMQANLPTACVTDLHVHGDDLIAATQGRAIWVLDGLAPLRALARGEASASAPWLAAPDSTLRVRINNNRDTPYPPEEPVGENPVEGVMIDYFLPDRATTIDIEIRDGTDNFVRRLGVEPAGASQTTAQRYFADFWIRPAPELSREPGLHRTSWDLRLPKPKSVSSEYSIAAVPGRDTPTNVQGALALPGQYRIVLRVDGTSVSRPLEIRQDPRVNVPSTDPGASLALWKSIAQALALGWQLRGEQQAIKEQLEKAALVLADRKDGAPLRERVAHLLAQLQHQKAPVDDLAGASELLAGIASDLESSDAAPTQAQARYAEQSMATMKRARESWSRLKDSEMLDTGHALAAAGLEDLRISAPGTFPALEGEEGEDLP